MMFVRVVLLLSLAILLTDCFPSEFHEAEQAVLSQLKDPDSAEFRDEKTVAAGIVCGWVNAKNSFGGYIGYRQFAYLPDSHKIMMAEGDRTDAEVFGSICKTP